MTSTRYRWNGSELVDNAGSFDVPLYVGDSFLLREGMAVDYPGHLARFERMADEQGLKRPIDDFLAAVTDALPRSGSHFPRIDLTSRGELELRVRPAPPLGRTVVLSTAAVDPRTEPTCKGPDIPALQELRDAAAKVGADEPIIVDAQGRIIDGASTCLVWIRENTVYTPPAEATRLESITVNAVEQLARDAGYGIATEWATPAQLAGSQVWALNALHGIRGVTSWASGPQLDLDESLLDQFRAAYDRLFAPAGG
jgi:branched-subunit amino acid aminotransferase/4-amino-4-deoxychorismate lyase